MHTDIKTTRMSRRGFVRLISFLTAGLIAFAIMAGVHSTRHGRATRHIENNYLRSLENLALSMDNIRTTLDKGFYTNSPQMLNDLSGRLANDASGAKVALSQLPVGELNLEKTNRFLSQVGNYSQSLARRFAAGNEITEQDRDNLNALYSQAEQLSAELWEIESMVAGGHLTFSQVFGSAVDNEHYPPHISDGFSHMEGIFGEEQLELVYDGPFSDHILTGAPRMLEGRNYVAKEESLIQARQVSGRDNLEFSNERGGRIPTYVFRGDGASVAFTKDGGIFANMLKHRRIEDKTINSERAIEIAEEFLDGIGIRNMIHTYYTMNGGVCVIKFACLATPDGGGHTSAGAPVVIYPDLIKIGVALDNGEVMLYDATPFITAHSERELPAPRLSESDVRANLSRNLEVQNVRLAIIPSSGDNEILCYEFLCVSHRGNQVLVYVNANTGAEEQISLMKISDSGTIVV